MMEDLLIKYIVGEASVLERKNVDDWIAAHPNNKAEYERFYTLWSNSKSNDNAIAPDVNAAWHRFVQKREELNSNSNTQTVLKVKKSRWKVMLSAAALLVIAISGFLFYWNTPLHVETFANTETINLPDHSKITLNSNSKLSYSRTFNKKDRQVQLEGEAFFDVSKNPQKPFSIALADEISVQVLGTSFNIKSSKDLTEVAVETGLVKVSKGNQSYTLKPKDKITFKSNQKEAEISHINNNLYQYYRTNLFVCDRTPLPDLIESLSDAYKVKIKIANPILEHQLLNSKFPTSDSVEAILTKVAFTLNARLERNGKDYILK